jgi:uroporphyrinogen-III synthase
MVLLRELARRPGQVVPRTQLCRLLPGNGGNHAVEAAIGRLRAALGDPAIIGTVIKRGYRLATE